MISLRGLWSVPLLTSCYLIRDDVLAKMGIRPLFTVTNTTFQGDIDWLAYISFLDLDASNYFKNAEYCTNSQSSLIFSKNVRKNFVDLLISSRFDFGFIK